MRLNVNFSGLQQAVKRMGADAFEPDLDVSRPRDELDEIDIQLTKGIEVDLAEVEVENGLLSYHGRQVLLYIQDHRNDVSKALEYPEQGRKYHVADCKTLNEMRAAGRFQRYVVTTDLSADFYITGKDHVSGKRVEGHARLRVCKFCLTHLNYNNYRNNRTQVFREFTLDKFFSTYSSFFSHLPRRRAGEYDGDYTDDWPDISARIKRTSGYLCSVCGVDLSEDQQLLHVHHIDGVKTNNATMNLQALCADCHRKQARHAQMYVSHDAMIRIAHLRRRQGIANVKEWEAAIGLADKGVHGLLALLQKEGKPVPEIGYELTDDRGAVVAELEVAWPDKRAGIAIAAEDIEAARSLGWRVAGIQEALDRR